MIKKILPKKIIAQLRIFKQKLMLYLYDKKLVSNKYAGHSFDVVIADNVAEGWYGNGIRLLSDIDFLFKNMKRKGAKVFDLGAHQGVVAMIMAKEVGEEGKIIAIEGNSHNSDIARENLRINSIENVDFYNMAVAEQSGSVLFNKGLNGAVDDGTGEWGQQKIEAVSIDDMILRYGVPDIIYMDLEGYECKALRGAKKARGHKIDWCIEVHRKELLSSFDCSIDEILAYFDRSKFEIFASENHRKEYFRLASSDQMPQGRSFLIAVAK
jgi:FkbM family methyltransferase